MYNQSESSSLHDYAISAYLTGSYVLCVSCRVGGSDASKKKIRFSDASGLEEVLQLENKDEYIERDSPYITYGEMQTPLGHKVRVPFTKLPKRNDKLTSMPLALPPGPRQFVPLMLLRKGEVFGLDQTPMCPSRNKSRTTILVSLGAEVIALNKHFYCRHAPKEGREAVEKTFIYDDEFIKRRLRERVNRDVHMEEVLQHYFHKVEEAEMELNK